MASADFIAGYQLGWSDKSASRTNQFPVPVTPPLPPVDPTVRVIQPTENFQTVIDTSAPTVTTFQLVTGKTYQGVGNWTPARDNFTLDGMGATAILTEPAACSSVFKLAKPNVTIRNLIVSMLTAGQDVMFRILAPVCSVINCTLVGPTIATFCLVDAGGTHALVQGNTVPLTNAVSIYGCEDDGQYLNNVMAGSYGETTFRISNRPDGHSPARVLVAGNTINGSYKNAKGSWELRSLGVSCVFHGNTMNDYGRAGQDGMTSPGQSIAGLLIDGNTWVGEGSIKENLMLKNGIITVSNNKFAVSIAERPITVSGPLTLTLPANNNTVTPVGTQLYNPAKPANVTINGA